MPFDSYSPCPGGPGKKIKFCCPELLSELQKIERMLGGEQYLACLKHIERLEQSHPSKACLLSVKTLLLRATERIDEAQAAAATFLEQYPESPVALAETAILRAATQSGREAMPTLVRAMAASDTEIHDRVYEALGVVSRVLAAEGQPLAARALAALQLRIKNDDRLALELTSRLNTAPSIPLVIKGAMTLFPCPADVPWEPAFDEALALAVRGQWLAAAERLAELTRQAGDAPGVWRNLAMLRGWMADTPGCIEALRRFSAMDVPLEDAVEAEALALFLSDDPLGDQVDVFHLSYSVDDADQLLEALSSAAQVIRIPDEQASFADDEEGPPPIGVFFLFDRALADVDGEVTLDKVPRGLCHALLYGKETDRAARLEVLGVAAPHLDQVQTLVVELAGGQLGPEVKEETAGRISATQDLLARRWRLPERASEEELERLTNAYIEKTMLETWPRSPSALLDGKSPLEAADQPVYRVRLLAAIMVLEFWLEQGANRFDFNRLRSRLGLPTLETIDPQQSPVEDLPPVRWSRVMADRLSDEALLNAYRRAFGYGAVTALRSLGRAVTERPGLAGRHEQLLAFEMLARSAHDSDEALSYLDRGRKAAEQAGQSSARWDLMELSFRARRQEGEEVSRVLSHLQSAHINEPGVAQALTDFFIQIGVLRPDGTVAAPAVPAGPGAPPLGGPGAEAPRPGELWTPESQKPAGEKPKIWTPGMD